MNAQKTLFWMLSNSAAIFFYIVVVSNIGVISNAYAGPFNPPGGGHILKTVVFPGRNVSVVALMGFPVPPGTTTEVGIPRVSGIQEANYTAEGMSASMQHFIFTTRATNLIHGHTPQGDHLYLYDIPEVSAFNKVKWVSRPTSGNALQVCNESNTCYDEVILLCAEISSDGRYVSFVSDATNLVAGQPQNGFFYKWYLYDKSTGITKLIASESESAFIPANCKIGIGISSLNRPRVTITYGSPGSLPVWSGNSSFVNGTKTRAENPASNGVYLYDEQSDSLSLVSTNSDNQPGNGSAGRALITSDGEQVIFESSASNLVSDDTNNTSDIFRKNVETGAIERISLDSNGEQLRAYNIMPFANSDGTKIAFTSVAARSGASFSSNSRNRANRPFADLTTNKLMLYDSDTNATQVLATTGETEPSYEATEVVFNEDGVYKVDVYNDDPEVTQAITASECLLDTDCAAAYTAPAPIVAINKNKNFITAKTTVAAPEGGSIIFKIKSKTYSKTRRGSPSKLSARFVSVPKGSYKVSYLYKDSNKRILSRSRKTQAAL